MPSSLKELARWIKLFVITAAYMWKNKSTQGNTRNLQMEEKIVTSP